MKRQTLTSVLVWALVVVVCCASVVGIISVETDIPIEANTLIRIRQCGIVSSEYDQDSAFASCMARIDGAFEADAAISTLTGTERILCRKDTDTMFIALNVIRWVETTNFAPTSDTTFSVMIPLHQLYSCDSHFTPTSQRA